MTTARLEKFRTAHEEQGRTISLEVCTDEGISTQFSMSPHEAQQVTESLRDKVSKTQKLVDFELNSVQGVPLQFSMSPGQAQQIIKSLQDAILKGHKPDNQVMN